MQLDSPFPSLRCTDLYFSPTGSGAKEQLVFHHNVDQGCHLGRVSQAFQFIIGTNNSNLQNKKTFFMAHSKGTLELHLPRSTFAAPYRPYCRQCGCCSLAVQPREKSKYKHQSASKAVWYTVQYSRKMSWMPSPNLLPSWKPAKQGSSIKGRTANRQTALYIADLASFAFGARFPVPSRPTLKSFMAKN